MFILQRILITGHSTRGSHSLIRSRTGRKGNKSLRNDISGFFGLVKLAITLAVVILIAAAAVSLLVSDNDDENDSDSGNYTESMSFGLSTTSTSIATGDNKTLSPNSYVYEDSIISWSSSDTSVATVSSEGVVTGVSEGSATITATCGNSSATCAITVSDSAADQLKVYNMNTSDYDCALINPDSDDDDGFETGQLVLSFNMANYAVVGLAGYDADWLSSNTSFIGNYLTDFSRIVITVSDGTSTVASTTYTSSSGGFFPGGFNPFRFGGTEVTGSSSTDYNRAQTSFDISSYMSETKFTVTVVLYVENSGFGSFLSPYTKFATITGEFTYCPGDGTMDSTGEFTREYSWRETSGGTVYSITLTFPYSEYLEYYSQNLYNCNTDVVISGYTYQTNIDLTDNETYVPLKCQSGTLIDSLVAALKTEYLNKNSLTSISDENDYAQYLLTFVQTCFMYAYEGVQYYAGGNYNTEYWAFPAETFWSGNGDCEDTSILAATIFKASGYDAGVYLVPGHAIAAVALNDYDTDGLITSSFIVPSGSYSASSYGIMKKTVDGNVYYGCETTVEQSREIGVINSSVTVSGTVYYYTDTSQSYVELVTI